MKKKTEAVLAAILALCMAFMLAACGNKGNEGSTPAESTQAGQESATEAQEKADASEATEEAPSVNVANPWQDGVSEQDVYVLVNAYFIVPDGAEGVLYRVLPSENLAEMDYKLDGMDFTARMKSTDTFEDISGMNYKWDVDEEQSVCGSEGRLRRAVTDEETADSLLWLDKPMHVMFSLSTAGKDLDGFDIVALAESTYQPADDSFMPGSFVEEKVEKSIFDSYDEILTYLDKGNAYAYFELEGYDGKLLAVTEETYDDLEGHQAAIEATFYGMFNGNVRFIGNAFSSGTAYPIRCDGAVIYAGGNHEYQSEFMNEDGTALIVKDYMYESIDEDGSVSYSGFRRQTNTSVDETVPADAEEGGKLFTSLVEEMTGKPVMDFTVVK